MIAPRRLLGLLWPLTAIAALGAVLASSSLRLVLVETVTHVRPLAVLATLPGQAAAVLLCGAALFVLRPGVSFGASLNSRLLRDAGANLLLFMPGLGEVIGARALVLAGGRTRAAVTASLLDNIAETIAQLPFAALALLVLSRLYNGAGPISAASIAILPWIAAAFAASIVLLAIVWRTARNKSHGVGRLIAWAENELMLLKHEVRGQWRWVRVAVVLHFVAWAMGGVQVWMVAKALSLPIGLFAAIVIESAAYAGRAVAFFVPAGLVVQEAGLVLAGLAYGLTPAQSLAIALVLRLRDLVFGLPLLLWPLLEFRRRS